MFKVKQYIKLVKSMYLVLMTQQAKLRLVFIVI